MVFAFFEVLNPVPRGATLTGGRKGARVGGGGGMLLSRCLTQHRGTASVGRGRKSIARNADRVYEQRNAWGGCVLSFCLP